MSYFKLIGLGLALAAGSCAAAPVVDVLDLPSTHSELATRSPLLDLTQAGQRLIAVGQRGHILYSDDHGQRWTQASVPVSSDLNAVQFPTEQQGWAVGHDGVVLHSVDAGATWTRQLDGRQLGRLMQDYYSSRPDAAQWLEEGKRIETEGADKPFLDLWFSDERNGFVVGAFNLIFHTRDGGQSWEPWMDRTDNPSGYHLNAISSDGKHLFIVGEQGLLLRLDDGGERFQALQSPYQGSFFGISAQPGVVLAYGMRGHAYRSSDGGVSWSAVNTGLSSNITASERDDRGHVYLFAQTGQAVVSADQGARFQPLDIGQAVPIYGALSAAEESLLLVGPRGVSQRTPALGKQEQQ
ncbi:YCF48-related protein [Pseudomonas extremaustralis]|uniref:WD40/YVTN/BNR-like repeat-containing protein n=1 Tax=Pseudomonas extremaustralis TaxID=359110 RepID=UPI0021CA0819|nr:YCF48-related protein [Pseudomonas extremaustralis]UUJ40902.1 YCF48-related protein [Pseudomonas extremaustralis]